MASIDTVHLPPGLRFGAATSSHQVEGGTTNNNWTRWETTTRPDGRPGIYTGERCGDAAEHWHRFESDVDLMTDLGLDIYRFSLEWSRIEPSPGRFDEAVIERYRSWCATLRAAGIAPMVTLHHFTDPLWVTDRGGWLDARTVDAFTSFVARIVPALAEYVDLWITVNEPNIVATAGWLIGEFPPGRVGDTGGMATALEHLLLAHGHAYHTIHALDTVDADGDGLPCRVSPAHHVLLFDASSPRNPLERAAAAYAHRVFNQAAIDAVTSGDLRLPLPGKGWRWRHHPVLRRTMDFMGVNHYMRMLVRSFRHKPYLLPLFDDTSPKNDMGWDLRPETLSRTLRFVARYGLPVIVTEHGTCDGDDPDIRRQEFLVEGLAELGRAARAGVPVEAYVHWSLLDNFEWAHGYGPRFGLYRVDYDTQERRLTGGGQRYREIIAAARAGRSPAGEA